MDIKEFFYSIDGIKKHGIRTIDVHSIKKNLRELEENATLLVVEDVESYSISEFYENIDIISLSSSKILSLSINNINIKNIKLTYSKIIRELYYFIYDVDKIKSNTILSIIDGDMKSKKGYVYFDLLDISVQGVTSERSLKEIFGQVICNNIIFKIEILKLPKRYIFSYP